MKKVLYHIDAGKGKMSDIDLLWDVQKSIDGNTICPLGDAAAWPVASAIRHFRDEFEYHIKHPDMAKSTFFPSRSISAGVGKAVIV